MSMLNTVMSGARQVLPVSGTPATRNLQFALALAGIAVVLALPALAANLLKDPVHFPVNNVDVLGTMDYADRDALIASVNEHMTKGFFDLDIDEVRQSLELKEWIASARVRRVWPSRISIEVQEHEPAARWNDDHLISKQLVLFKPHQLERASAEFGQWSEVFKSLPQVLGAQGRHIELLDDYRNYDRQLSALNLRLGLLKDDDRLSQTLKLANGDSIRLGTEQHELRMSRFLDVYERLREEADGGPLSFDLRYTNGFALSGVNPDESLRLEQTDDN